MKRRVISIIMVMLLMLSTFTPSFADNIIVSNTSLTFVDVKTDHWANEAINNLSSKGIIGGYPDGSFKPNGEMTRAEFAKLITLTFGLDLVREDAPTFTDVNKDEWYYEYVETSKEFLTGYFPPRGRAFFDPLSKATREDVAVALTRVMNLNPEDVSADALRYTFNDYNEISPNLQAEVALAVKAGLINGYPDKSFRPHEPLNRAAAATMLYRVMKSSYANANKEIEITVNIPDKVSTPSVKVTGKVTKDARVYIDDKEISVYEGRFEEMYDLIDGEDVYTFEIKAVLPNGRFRVIEKSVRYEVGLPVLTINIPTTSTKPTINISGKLTDNGDKYPTLILNDKSVYVSYNGQWNVDANLKEGENKFVFIATNTSGKRTKIEKTVIFNAGAPEIIIENMPETTTNKTITITGKGKDGSDDHPAVYINDKKVTYSYSYGKFSQNYTLKEGENIFTFKVVNNLGKSYTLVKKVIFSVGAPEITIENMPETTTDKNITITGRGKDANDDHPAVYINDKKVTYSYSYGKFSENYTLKEGENIFTFKVVNNLGKSYTLVKKVNLNISGPEIEVNIPETINKNNIVISGKITDGFYSYDKLSLTINGRNVSLGYGGSWSYNAELVEGSNMITIIGSNPSGKQKKIDKILDYKILAPIIDLVVPEKTNMSSITISGKAYDNIDSSPILSINGESVSLGYSGNFNKDISLIEGSNTITLTVTSNKTGKSSTTERIIVSEILAPVLNVNISENSDSDTIQISGNVSDIVDANPIVAVNGVNVTVSSSGIWNSNVQLFEGQNSIIITATNKLGKITTIEKSVTYTLQ